MLWSTGSRCEGFSSCGTQAQLPFGLWDLPRLGIKPVSPALAGGFLTTGPPGKSKFVFLCTRTAPFCPHWEHHLLNLHPRFYSFTCSLRNTGWSTPQPRQGKGQVCKAHPRVSSWVPEAPLHIASLGVNQVVAAFRVPYTSAPVKSLGDPVADSLPKLFIK